MKRRSKLSSQNKKIDIKSSGEDEFSGSEKDVFYKRSGQMEFDLNADVKANEKRLKHSFKLCLLGLVIIIAIYKFHMIGSLSKTNVDEIVINQTETGWKRTFKNRLFGGANVMFDVDEDGKPDILSGAGDLMTYNETLFCMESNDDDTAGQFSHFHDLCKDFNLTYPCKAVIFAVRGYDGKLLWELPVRSIPLFFNCEDVDVNQDNKTDCIVSGRSGTLMAFDPRKGKTLWMSEPQDFIKANWNVYRVVAIGDLDNDGVTELLVSNGGNPAKTAEETDRDPGRLLVVSGADGKPYGRRYLNMPNRRETYMSPILYKPFHHYYILFGSGGEAISGDLMGIDLTDFLCYTFPNPECKARNDSTDPWNLKEKNEDNIFIIYRGEKKGVMVTPVIVDANNDGVQDIILSMFEGKIVLIDGKTANEVWTTLYNGMESYSTPAPGYFNNDDILDYMVNWNKGAWFTYSSANVSIINGKDGSILWTLSSAYMQFSSSLVASTNHKHKHAFVFRQQGRGSVFRWTPGGQILRPGETLNDLKLHLSIKDTDSDMQRPHDDYEVVFPDELDKDDLKRLNMTRVDYKRLKYKLTTLTCEDDVDSFRGEVLMIDIDSLNSAYRIIDRPMEKYHYKVKNINVDHFDSNTHLDSKYRRPLPVQEGDVARSAKSQGSGGGLLTATITPNTNSKQESRIRKCKGLTQIKGPLVEMCSTEEPDLFSTGMLGDFDGDGFLDYIGVYLRQYPKYNRKYYKAGADMDVLMQKVNVELLISKQTLEKVHLNAVTDMQVTKDPQYTPSTPKRYLPPTEQPWTQFMGKSQDSIYQKNISTII